MKQFFTTKRDVNGNRYTLLIDNEKKEFKADYNTTSDYSFYVTISKPDRQKLISQLLLSGYTEK